jgi:hypothetical protein
MPSCRVRIPARPATTYEVKSGQQRVATAGSAGRAAGGLVIPKRGGGNVLISDSDQWDEEQEAEYCEECNEKLVPEKFIDGTDADGRNTRVINVLECPNCGWTK